MDGEIQDEEELSGPDVNLPTAFDPRILLMLLTVAEAGSINRAAKILNLSQPALSKNFRDFEARLGVPILERSRSGTNLTAIGESLCQNARAIRAELSRAQRQFEDMRSPAPGTLRIGVGHISERYLLPRAVELFIADRPGCQIYITESSVGELTPSLRHGEIDLILGPLWQHEPRTDDTELLREPLFEIDTVVVARPDHPLAYRQRLTPANLLAFGWILPTAGFRLRALIDNALIQCDAGIPKTVIECSPNSVARNLVRNTDFIAPLPLQSITSDIAAGSLAIIDFDLKIPRRPAGIITEAKACHSTDISTFVDCLRQAAEEANSKLDAG